MKGDLRNKTVKERELRKLGARIRDEEHLNEILRDARPNFRSAVRAQLRPYLNFALKPDVSESDTIEEQCP